MQPTPGTVPLGDPRVLEQLVGRIGLLGGRLVEVAGAVGRSTGVDGTDRRAVETLAAEGPMTVAALGGAVGLRSAAATALVDRLEHAGVARRRRDDRDRRRVLVHLDASVAERAAEITRPLEQHLVAALSGLTTTQLRTVLAAIDVVVEAADAALADAPTDGA